MSKRENDAVAAVLTDPENESRTAEEVADLAIEALDEVRAKTHRLAVVGQISFSAFADADEEHHTVVLGPFSARGILDTQEKFRRATEGGSAARSAGQDLAWDSKTGKGRGRFMLAPAFLRPRSAWDFFRPEEVGKKLTSKMLIEGGWKDAAGADELAADLAAWQPGLWAAQAAPGPVCHCGLPDGHSLSNSLGETVDRGRCPRHAA